IWRVFNLILRASAQNESAMGSMTHHLAPIEPQKRQASAVSISDDIKTKANFGEIAAWIQTLHGSIRASPRDRSLMRGRS
ncbi:MAG: hypothetical protein VX500_12110, partial [Planctomycetota bacterium]|nr:hypothetical protein [Planctomycetota bacterium]